MTTARKRNEMPHELPRPGDKIGEYELVDTIGRGGFGAVYKARQVRLAREVAIKVLNPHGAGGDVDLARHFMREVDLARRLEHPNIVRLYDAGETRTGLLWMAMELVRGDELALLLHREGRLSVARARRIMLQVLSALAEAHEFGIVHRDLKPANIMITRKGADEDVVKLLDFGVGKAFGCHEDAAVQNLTLNENIVAGTPRYMAPELLLRENEGAHSDVYAAGLILVEMLQGFPACEGDSPFELLANQVKGNLSISSSVACSTMHPLIERATRKDWRDRYQSALEFHEALKSLRPVAARAASGAASPPPPPPLPGVRRRDPSFRPEPAGGALVPINQLHLLSTDGAAIEVTVLEDEDPFDPSTLHEDSDPIIEVIVLDSDGTPDEEDTASIDRDALADLVAAVPVGRPLRTTTATPARKPERTASRTIKPPPIQSAPRLSSARFVAVTPDEPSLTGPLPGATARMSRRATLLAIAAVLAVAIGGSVAVVSAAPETPVSDSVAMTDTRVDPDDDDVAQDDGDDALVFEHDEAAIGFTVDWHFETRPRGARVLVGGRLACEPTPCSAALQPSDDAVDLRVELEGHDDLQRTLVPRGSGHLELALTPAATARDDDGDAAPPGTFEAAGAAAALSLEGRTDTTPEEPERTRRRTRRDDPDDARDSQSRRRKKKHARDPFAIKSD